jgi:hypothetical protein
MTGHSERPHPKQNPREALDSFTDVPTDLITLPPAFIEALRALAPKRRPRKWPYVVAAVACIGAMSGLRNLWPGHPNSAGAAVDGSQLRASTPGATSAAADSAATSSSLGPNETPSNGPGGTPRSPPAAVRPTISLDDVPQAPLPKASKATKHRTQRLPR